MEASAIEAEAEQREAKELALALEESIWEQ